MKKNIDFVLPWVDNNNPDWQRRYAMYTAEKGDSSNIRFRDWDLLRYWFRGVEKFAPWFRKIHFITSGELPGWLNLEHPALNWVKHEDYIPAEYLPTFSSYTIELNMHRINGLSENFIYFNDDFFILKPVSSSRFFYKNLPCDCAIMTARPATSSIVHSTTNCLDILDKHFDKHTVMKKHFFKWFSLRYKKKLVNNILLYPWKVFSGFIDPHIPYAYLKDTLPKIWEAEPELLDKTCKAKFRSNEGVHQWLMRYWQLAEGNFYPKNTHENIWCIDINENTCKDICHAIAEQKYEMICINDSTDIIDFEECRKNISDTFEKLLPEKSSFEKF